MGLNKTIEIELILTLSKLTVSDEEIIKVKNMLELRKLDFDKLVSMLFLHRTSMTFYKNLKKFNLTSYFPNKLVGLLSVMYLGNKMRNTYYYEQTVKIFNAFYSEGIKCIPMKGTILNHQIYKDYGLRYSGDMDILIQDKNLSKVTSILNEHGFVQGYIKNGSIDPATKELKMFHRLSTHELVPFLLETNEEVCEFIEFDVQFDIFNRAKNMRVNYNLEQLFDTAIEIDIINEQAKCYSLKPEYNVLQLSSHLYQDATRIQGIKERKDQELIKYVDVYEYINQFKHEMDWATFAEELVTNQVNHIVYYTLYHTEILFGQFIDPAFMDSIKPDNLSYLDIFGVEEDTKHNWEIPFLERFFNSNRINELEKLDDSHMVESEKYRNIVSNLGRK